MKKILNSRIVVILFIIPFTLFSQKGKKGKTSDQNIMNYEYLGLSLNSKPGNENKLFYNQPQVISLIGCTDCEIKASTIFETEPDKKVYLTPDQFKVEKNKSLFNSNDCQFESSFFSSNAVVVTSLLQWAPIAPITLEFYRNGKKLAIEKPFEMEY
ncbi:MAG: hypothetical protein FJZ67_05490 [Bacteroidetes bacterium]|nr:hypothetical protein [Bacteroidota bacterium]